MVNLFLSKPPANGSGGETAGEGKRMLLLQTMESVIWSVITAGGRYEPRLWLCNAISRIRSVDPQDQRKLFVGLLESKPSKRDVAAQVLRMIFDKRPGMAGPILSRKCFILEEFFEGHPRRILQWFDHFACTAGFGHKKGARALSQFAFANRDICWEDLEWKGKHGQSPAVVATKPHYFHDLDVLKTVENFLEHVPEFWSSDELAESVKDGAILHIDTQFFADQFIHLMYEENTEDIWAMIDDFVVEEQFSSLCQRLLILLSEDELHGFLVSLSKLRRTRWACDDFGYQSAWVERVLSSSDLDDITLNDLLLVNAITNEGRQIIRLLGDEEHELASCKMKELVDKILSCGDGSHWILMMECGKSDLFMAIRWTGLESWVIHYTLSKECKNQEYCESLFTENGIVFKRSGEYSLIPSIESSSDSDDEDYRRRKRSRKKRKSRKHVSRETDVDELIDLGASDGDFLAGRRIWLLSTDGFSFPWNMNDLPEHLSRHCFSSWMKWVWST